MKRLTSIFTTCLAVAGIVAFMAGCDKNKPYGLITAEPQVHFIGTKVQLYQMLTNPAPAYKINIGTTDVSNADRTATVNVTSTTATLGTHYSIVGGTTVTIPAGQSLASVSIQGVQTFYTTGRKDTLRITLAQPSINPSKFSDTILLVLRGPCFDDEIVFANLAGSYTKTFENGSYGPYTTTIAAPINQTSATTSTANFTNLYDNLITANATFTYATVGSFTVNFAPQQTQYTSGGLPLFIRSTPATTSTFTYCTPTFTLYLDLYTSAGLYDRWVMTTSR